MTRETRHAQLLRELECCLLLASQCLWTYMSSVGLGYKARTDRPSSIKKTDIIRIGT